MILLINDRSKPLVSYVRPIWFIQFKVCEQGGVYMRKLAPVRVSYRHDFLISYRVYMMAGLFHISLFEGTLHVDKMQV